MRRPGVKLAFKFIRKVFSEVEVSDLCRTQVPLTNHGPCLCTEVLSIEPLSSIVMSKHTSLCPHIGLVVST